MFKKDERIKSSCTPTNPLHTTPCDVGWKHKDGGWTRKRGDWGGIEENFRPHTHKLTPHPSQDFPWPCTKLPIKTERIFQEKPQEKTLKFYFLNQVCSAPKVLVSTLETLGLIYAIEYNPRAKIKNIQSSQNNKTNPNKRHYNKIVLISV